MKKLFIIIVLISLLPSISTAHAIGSEVAKVDKDFLFEFAQEPQQITAGTVADLSIAIHNAMTNEAIGVDGVWIRVSDSERAIFSSTDFYTTNESVILITQLFPEAGNYEITVAVSAENARVSFPINITAMQATPSATLPVIFGVSTTFFLIIALLGMVILRRNR